MEENRSNYLPTILIRILTHLQSLSHRRLVLNGGESARHALFKIFVYRTKAKTKRTSLILLLVHAADHLRVQLGQLHVEALKISS